MPRIPIPIAKVPYEAVIERGELKHAGAELVRALGRKPSKCCIVTSAPIWRRWGKVLERSLRQEQLEFEKLMVPDGERAKAIRTVEALAARMVRAKADRASVVIAFGGGVVGDIAGFLASIYMRGIPVLQVPTTLLAQVDAAIGGKTGVNLAAGKNLLGTFHQPCAVVIDPEVLKTLPDREFRAGLFEVLKCGIIRDPEIVSFLEREGQAIRRRDADALQWIITAAVRVKAAVVAADEKESGERRVLNFGHTIGHALEAETAYKKFLHGEAVGWGMVAAARIAAATGRLSPQDQLRIESNVFSLARLPGFRCNTRKILSRLGHDKKTLHGHIHFVLPVRIGAVETISDVPESTVIRVLEGLRREAAR